MFLYRYIHMHIYIFITYRHECICTIFLDISRLRANPVTMQFRVVSNLHDISWFADHQGRWSEGCSKQIWDLSTGGTLNQGLPHNIFIYVYFIY